MSKVHFLVAFFSHRHPYAHQNRFPSRLFAAFRYILFLFYCCCLRCGNSKLNPNASLQSNLTGPNSLCILLSPYSLKRNVFFLRAVLLLPLFTRSRSCIPIVKRQSSYFRPLLYSMRQCCTYKHYTPHRKAIQHTLPPIFHLGNASR